MIPLTNRELEIQLIESLTHAAFPSQEARYIMTYLLDCTATEYYLLRDKPAKAEYIARAKQIIAERQTGRPLQYILGETEFYGLIFKVGEGCLIPRADTENLVKYIAENAPRGARMLDLCTGSGCIAVTVLYLRPDMTAAAIDISESALKYAAINAANHNVSDRLTLCLQDILTGDPSVYGMFDILASNPPYLTPRDMDELEREVTREPELALLGGADGLLFYRTITSRWIGNIKPNGMLLFEVGLGQHKQVSEMLKPISDNVEVICDLNGIERVVLIPSIKSPPI